MKEGLHLVERTNINGEVTEKDIILPDWDWLWEQFDSKSKAIRYMHFTLNIPIAIIARYLNLGYRHVYSVVTKAKAKQNQPGVKCCIVCGK